MSKANPNAILQIAPQLLDDPSKFIKTATPQYPGLVAVGERLNVTDTGTLSVVDVLLPENNLADVDVEQARQNLKVPSITELSKAISNVLADSNNYVDTLASELNNSFSNLSQNVILEINGKKGTNITLSREDLNIPSDEQIALQEKEDLHVITKSGRTQREKNSDYVSSLDFGIIPDSLDDQTSKFDSFTDYLRTVKKKGYIVSGNYIVSPNKIKTFGTQGASDFESVDYCIDISGIQLEGEIQGYRNANGVILSVNPLVSSNNSVVLMQAQQAASQITYALKGFAFRNAQTCLRMTYAVHCDISHLYWNSTCTNGIVLGEFTFESGPLFNKFSDCNGVCSGVPLDCRGKNWNNANVFKNFYVSGGLPSKFNVTGGYGAIANLFIGGEFASTSTGSHGIELGRTNSTTFLNTYFEPHGHAIVFDGLSRQTHLKNCTYGTTNADLTEGVRPSILYHRGNFKASVIIDGGTVYLGSEEKQSNMRFIESGTPENLSIYMYTRPSLGGSSFGYETIDDNLLLNLGTFEGVLASKESELKFATAGVTPTNLASTSKMTWSISGNLLTCAIRLDKTSDAVFPEGSIYFRLPRAPKSAGNYGNVIAYKVTGVTEQFSGTCSVLTSGNMETLLQKITATSVLDPTTQLISTSIRNNLVSLTSADIVSLGNGGYLRLSVTYRI